MVTYPRIAKIHYKDKHIDVKINVRAKLAVYDEYRCNKCYSRGTLKQVWRKWYDKWSDSLRTHNANAELAQVNYRNQPFPASAIKKDNLCCPVCGEELFIAQIKKIKLYVRPTSDYIRFDKILWDSSLARWYPLHSRYGTSYFTFCDTITQMYDFFSARPKCRSDQHITLEIDKKITLKMLTDKYKEYEMKKFAEAI